MALQWSPTPVSLSSLQCFESIALSTAPRPPSLWFRYVDDTFVLTHEDDVDSLTSHINNIDDNILFTTEPETQGKLPFLDLCITVLDDASTKITSGGSSIGRTRRTPPDPLIGEKYCIFMHFLE